MGLKDRLFSRDRPGGLFGLIFIILFRFLQFVLALTVAGLYGVDLHHAHQKGAYTDGKWVYAEVVAGAASITVIVYTVLFFITAPLLFAVWDWVLFILWTALFGLFGKIFISAHPTPEQHGQQRMKSAVWVDLVNMLLWFITATWYTVQWLRSRRNPTMHTGRGDMKA